MRPDRLLAEFLEHPNSTQVPVALWATLNEEEARELLEELRAEPLDLLKIARELADVVYVAYGTAHTLNIDLGAALAEVHRANMTKMAANVRRADGKVIKPPGFVAPDMRGAVRS